MLASLSYGIAAQAKDFDTQAYDQLKFDDQTIYGLALTETQNAMYQVFSAIPELPQYDLELSQLKWLKRELSVCKPISASAGCISKAKDRAKFIEQVWPEWKALAVLGDEVQEELPKQLQAQFEKIQRLWWTQFLKSCDTQTHTPHCELLTNKRIDLLQNTYREWNEANIAHEWLKGEQTHLANIEKQILKLLNDKERQLFGNEKISFARKLRMNCNIKKRAHSPLQVSARPNFSVFKNDRCEAALLKERSVLLDERLQNISEHPIGDMKNNCYYWSDEITVAHPWLTTKSLDGVRLANGEVCISSRPGGIKVDIFYSGYDSNMCGASYDFRAIEGTTKIQSKFIRYVYHQYDEITKSQCVIEARFTPNTIHLSGKDDVCRSNLDGCGHGTAIPTEIPLWLPSKPWKLLN